MESKPWTFSVELSDGKLQALFGKLEPANARILSRIERYKGFVTVVRSLTFLVGNILPMKSSLI